ncbi:hypothetical protein AVEN_227124-1 [Araneus ventricosus]|uniref:Tc1-like transposase DDE domain-containing protein n=1 Tax=Araneus ventricosus TaxID=182803 RepID=A0A4Y2BUE1_ARAVE|nr:hypothetical protein AVEN_227124-1 [Araneus ventricosus]
MLQLYAVPRFPEGVIFQQDGAPPHYGNIVREFLDTTFPQRWIGRGAVMAWPPRSPDITPLDFYLWGYVKQHVYSERINDISHLKQRITDVIHSVTPDVLTRVWEKQEPTSIWFGGDLEHEDEKLPDSVCKFSLLLEGYNNDGVGWLTAPSSVSGHTSLERGLPHRGDTVSPRRRGCRISKQALVNPMAQSQIAILVCIKLATNLS